MKKVRIFALFTSLLLVVSLFGAPLSASAMYDLPEEKTITAGSAILVCLGSDRSKDVVLFEREADTKILPSALIRVMTTLVALDLIEEKGIDIEAATGTYDQEKFNLIAGTGLGTAMNYQSKETWTIKDLLNISFIQTAADAAVTLAVSLAGSHEAFVDRMNKKAEELGCTNTHFVNVHAADTPNQYVSARDMYLITREAMDNPKFMNIARQTQYTVTPVSGGTQRTYPNLNDMIRPSSGDSYYKPMLFGRTGTTDTGRNMVSVASDSGYDYLVVVLDTPLTDADGKRAYSYIDDTKELFRWAFNSFTYSTILSKNQPVDEIPVNLAWNTDKVSLVPKEDFATVIEAQMSSSTIRKNVIRYQESLDAPVEKGQVLGKVELYINVDKKIGEVELVAAESVEASQALVIWAKVSAFLTSPWFYGALIFLLVLLAGYILLNVLHNRKRKRRKMKRIKRYK